MRNHTLGILFAFSLMALEVFPPAPAWGNDQVGSVVAVRGTVVSVDTQGKSRALTIKSPVYLHDTLKTGPLGRVQVLFSDNTIISLGKDSQMEIQEHVWKPGQKTGAMKTKIKEGVFRVMGGAIAKEAPKNFTTETPAATIGIRGSMYAGRMTDGTLMVVFEGGKGIDVSNGYGSVSITRPGLGTHIPSPASAPEKPARVKPQEIMKMNKDMAVDVPPQQETSAAPVQVAATGSATESSSTAASQDTQGTGTGSEGSTAQSTGDQTDQQAGGGETATSPGEAQAGGTGVMQTDPPAGVEPIETPVPDPTSPPMIPPSVTIPPDLIKEVPLVATVDLSGIFMSALMDDADAANTFNNAWYTTSASGTSTNGALNGTAIAQDSTVFTFGFKVAPYNPTASYSPPTGALIPMGRTVNLMGADRSFDVKIDTDPLGECTIFGVSGSFTAGPLYTYQEIGIFGPRVTLNLPTTGIDIYSGPALGFEMMNVAGQTWQDSVMGSMNMGINWHSGKVLGLLQFESSGTPPPSPELAGPPVFFFGDLNRSTGSVDNIRLFGDKGFVQGDPSGTIRFLEGSGGFGQFYGSVYQGFGFMGTGNDYDVSSDMTTRTGISRGAGAGYRLLPTQSSGTGTALFSGFAVGIGEDMNNPIAGRRVLLNTDPSDFTLALNLDQGTLTGSLSAPDVTNPNFFLSNLELGGSFGSAYIDDHVFAALMGDTGNNGVSNYGMLGGLKPYGSYLVTADPALQRNEYLTWGYWEMAYVDPASSADYHVHHPGSLWIAGELTPSAALQGLISNNFVATYTGGAHGAYYDTAGQMNVLTNGLTNMTIDFNPSAAQPISGSIRFDQVQMNLQNGLIDKEPPTYTVPNSRFSADAVISGAASGGVFGAFYGPNAEAVGGNFNASSGGRRYIGVFEGKR